MTHQATKNCAERQVRINASMFDDLLSYQAKHLHVLKQLIRAVEVINADARDQRLADVLIMLEALTVGSAGVLQEQIRVAEDYTTESNPTADRAREAH